LELTSGGPGSRFSTGSTDAEVREFLWSSLGSPSEEMLEEAMPSSILSELGRVNELLPLLFVFPFSDFKMSLSTQGTVATGVSAPRESIILTPLSLFPFAFLSLRVIGEIAKATLVGGAGS
jgi:hypothetical protein